MKEDKKARALEIIKTLDFTQACHLSRFSMSQARKEHYE